MRLRAHVVAALILVASASHADVIIDPEARTVTVAGFSAEQPGTLMDVVAAAEGAGWSGVSIDEVAHTVTIDGALIIGAGDGSSTYFRIGTAERPDETLVMRGDLKVTQPAASGYRQFTGTNQLLIGDPTMPELRPTLKFDCERPKQFGLMVEDGTVLDVHNAVITAARQQRECVTRFETRALQTRISNSTLSWIGGDIAYGLYSLASPMRDVIVEHGGQALANGTHWVVDCVFRDLDTAVRDGGALDATLIRCRFEDNRRNWSLGFGRGIVAIDCTFGEPEDPGPHIQRGRIGDGSWLHPRFVALRHIQVQVTDGDGGPIEGALVEIAETAGDPAPIHNGAALTAADGRTPALNERGALFVTDYSHLATDDVPEPDSRDCRIETHEYRYVMRVTADGYRTKMIEDIDPDQSWTEMTVTLQAQ